MYPERSTATAAVLLDAGGVLLMPDPAAFRRRLAGFGVMPDDETCRRAHFVGMTEVDRCQGDFAAADRVVARALGVADDALEDAAAAVLAVYHREPFVAVPDAAAQLGRLSSAGYALAVVSNAGGTVQERLAEHGICAVGGGQIPQVAAVVDSFLVGVEKPDPAIFTFALEALGVDPVACLYVGDSVHFDVGGARAAGIAPVHLSPYGHCTDPDHGHVTSLRALVDALVS